jgi:branched-chain amino acid transport system permease protein
MVRFRGLEIELKRDRLELRLMRWKGIWFIEPRYWRNGLIAFSLLLLLPIPLAIFSPAFLTTVVNANVYAIMGFGMLLLVMGTGRLNFGPQLYLGVGGYVAALLSSRLSPYCSTSNPLITLLCAIGASAVAGLAMSPFALFRRGLYYALATMLPPLMFLEVTYIYADVFKGEVGLSLIPKIVSTGDVRLDFTIMAYLSFLVMIVCFFVVQRITQSRWGVMMAAILDDDEVAAMFGVNTTRIKIVMHVIGACIMGVSGWFLAHSYGTFAGTTYLTFLFLMRVFLVFFLGGHSIYGTIMGGFFVAFLDSIVNRVTVSLGVALIQQLIFLAIAFLLISALGYEGLWGLYRKRRYREYRSRMKLR